MSARVVLIVRMSMLRADCEIRLCVYVCVHTRLFSLSLHASDGPAAPLDAMGISQFALNIKKPGALVPCVCWLLAARTQKKDPAYPPLTLSLKLMRAHTGLRQKVCAGAFQQPLFNGNV